MRRVALLSCVLGCLLVAGVSVVVVAQRDELGAAGDAAVAEDDAVRQDLSALVHLDGDDAPPAVTARPHDAPRSDDGTDGEPAVDPTTVDTAPEPADAASDATPGDGAGHSGDGAGQAGEAEHAELVAHLERTFRRHGPPGTFGLAVVGPDGELVFARHADRPLIPASTQKLVTAALALETLGAEHRLRTEAHAVGALQDGVLHGDLLVVGGGDPALGDPRWGRVVPERPRTPLEGLADQVIDAGVREIRGQVIGLATLLPWEPEAAGWPSRYFTGGHTTRSSGLTVNGGRRLTGDGSTLRSEPADSPALETARVLRDLLRERGVAVASEPGVLNENPGSSGRLAAVESAPVADLLRYTVRRSDNHLADTVWRMAGRASGDGSWASGGQAAVAMLADLGVDLGGARFADGSGLSRHNLITARQLATLDQRMAVRHGGRWDGLMAVSARSGTLRRRLHGTIAAGALHAKTGTLRDVRALAGSVHGPHGRWHFALLANDVDGAAIRRFRRLSDDLAIVLARETRGCDLAGC